MTRRKLSLALAAILAPALLLTVFSAAAVLADGPHHPGYEHHGYEHHVYEHHGYEHHEHHGVYINGVLTYGGGSYVVQSPPVVTGTVFVYDLYARSNPQVPWQLAGRYFVTEYPGAVNWGGFQEARQTLASQGLETFYRTTFWRTTVE